MQQCPECEMMVAEGHALCPSCDNQIRETEADCDRCGEPLAMSATSCPQCGDLRADARCARHADRPAVARCVLCGDAVCEECDAAGGTEHRCPEHADVPMIEGWAEVLSIPDEIEARLIEGNLRAEGVESQILSQKDHYAIPVEFGDLARVRVLVPGFAYTEAERILAAHRDERGEVSFG